MTTPLDDPSQPGAADEMAAAIEDLVSRVTAAAARYSDPVDQADSLELALAQIPAIQNKLGQARSAAVAKALETRPATEIAEQMGLTRQRVYQLARGADGSTP